MRTQTVGNIRRVAHATVYPMADLDRDSSVPLWQQLVAELRRRIADDGMRRIPSYVSLMQEYGVSRETADRAIHHLVDRGEAHIVNGKGTYAGSAPEDPS